MGCDIHGLVERRINKKWVTWITIGHVTLSSYDRRENELDSAFPAALSRNYVRFAALAGVRGDGPAPKGVPEDASESARAIISGYGRDGHSHSHLLLAEAARIFSETEGWRTWETPDWYGRKYPVAFFFGVDDADDLADYRLVFWFDN